MLREDFRKQYVEPFNNVSWIYNNFGFIVWRMGTGNNTELLHIKTFVKGKGHGRQLVYGMLDRLQLEPPYNSVFGFTRTSNTEAQKFYGALGFNLQNIEGLYKDGTAVMFWQEFTELVTIRQQYVEGAKYART